MNLKDYFLTILILIYIYDEGVKLPNFALLVIIVIKYLVICNKRTK